MSTVILSYNICKYIYLKLKVGKLINYIVGYVDIIRILSSICDVYSMSNVLGDDNCKKLW